MVRISSSSIYENYIDPVTQKPAFKAISSAVAESVKIVAAVIFVELFNRKISRGLNGGLSDRQITIETIYIPLLEEFLFRGLLLKGIHWIQNEWHVIQNERNDSRKKILTNEDLKTQQVFRVHLSAFIFAAVHLTNSHATVFAALFQFTHAYILGVSYGYISEKYKTLSIGILQHGVNNSLAIAEQVFPLPCFLAIRMLDIASYALAIAPTFNWSEIKKLPQMSRQEITENYIQPVRQHRLYKITAEIVKILAAKIFLELLGNRFLTGLSGKISENYIFDTTVMLPMAEEISARGILQRGISLMQKGWNYYRNKDLTEADLKGQQVFRVHLSALFFPVTELILGFRENAVRSVMAFAWSYFRGVSLGHLSEKYHTLSVSMISNGISQCLIVASEAHPVLALAAYLNTIAAYILATTNIDQKVFSGLGQTVHYCTAAPRRWLGRSEAKEVLC